MNKPNNFIPFITTFLIILAIQNFLIGQSSSKKVSYNEFHNLLKNKKISEGHTFLGQNSYKSHDYSEETAREIDIAIKEIVDTCYIKTTKLLQANIAQLKSSALKLLETETLENSDIQLLQKELNA